MFKINEFEKKISKFREDYDYSIAYANGIVFYSFHSEAIKEDLWGNKYVPNDEFNYMVERGNGGFRAYKTTTYQKGGNSKPTKPVNFAFHPFKSGSRSLSSTSESKQVDIRSKNNFLDEEFIVGEDMEISPSNVVSSSAYAIRRKQEGNKIIEERKELDYSPFGISEKKSSTPKIMEINDNGEMKSSNEDKNWEEEKRKEMIEARNNFQSVFTEKRKKELLEAKEAFIEANKANIPFYSKK